MTHRQLVVALMDLMPNWSLDTVVRVASRLEETEQEAFEAETLANIRALPEGACVIHAKNRTRGRAADHGGMYEESHTALDSVLLDEEAQPIIARLGAACCPDSPIDVETHALRIASVALRAKRTPFNAYARATL